MKLPQRIVLIVIFLLAFVSTSSADWRRGTGWNEGDLYMDRNSIVGDVGGEGLKFDPDNDKIDEIVMEDNGTNTVDEVNYTGLDGNAGNILITDGLGNTSFSNTISGDLSIGEDLTAARDVYIGRNEYVTGDITANAYFGDGSNLQEYQVNGNRMQRVCRLRLLIVARL